MLAALRREALTNMKNLVSSVDNNSSDHRLFSKRLEFNVFCGDVSKLCWQKLSSREIHILMQKICLISSLQ